jgi:hypothetical protein
MVLKLVLISFARPCDDVYQPLATMMRYDEDAKNILSFFFGIMTERRDLVVEYYKQ